MDRDRILQVVDILMYLLKVPEWEVRHGALLGIKYLMAVKEVIQIFHYLHRNDFTSLIMISVFPTGFTR